MRVPNVAATDAAAILIGVAIELFVLAALAAVLLIVRHRLSRRTVAAGQTSRPGANVDSAVERIHPRERGHSTRPEAGPR